MLFIVIFVNTFASTHDWRLFMETADDDETFFKFGQGYGAFFHVNLILMILKTSQGLLMGFDI